MRSCPKEFIWSQIDTYPLASECNEKKCFIFFSQDEIRVEFKHKVLIVTSIDAEPKKYGAICLNEFKFHYVDPLTSKGFIFLIT